MSVCEACISRLMAPLFTLPCIVSHISDEIHYTAMPNTDRDIFGKTFSKWKIGTGKEALCALERLCIGIGPTKSDDIFFNTLTDQS